MKFLVIPTLAALAIGAAAISPASALPIAAQSTTIGAQDSVVQVKMTRKQMMMRKKMMTKKKMMKRNNM